ncbi:hypothetical protein KM043_010477 [Ampulex compressa]|nr:hypothetical protein KM043_010477 [Ampulex compressa]
MFGILLIAATLDVAPSGTSTAVHRDPTGSQDRKVHSAISDVRSYGHAAACGPIGQTERSDEKSQLGLLSPQGEYGGGSSSSSSSSSSALRERSYYTGYGTPASTAYYPGFEPISILASLAFLAFLLQSFASLFDLSGHRGSARLAPPEAKTLGGTEAPMGVSQARRR